jgi:hypothetical protein
MNIDYSGLPAHMQQGFKDYIENGYPPGGFMHAVLCNDLFDACAQADGINRHALFYIVSWIYNNAPRACWGDVHAIKYWMAMKAKAREAA